VDNLIFPLVDFRVSKEAGKTAVFDIIRRKFIVLTPEEWVRQHLVHYMIDHLKYPKALINVEDGLRVNKMQKRSDVVIHNRRGSIFMIAECKSFKIKLKQGAMDQLSNYNQRYKAAYLALTNGRELFLCQMDYERKSAQFISEFPEFKC
jgi:hypothetical protein